jgi:hypothetical protein
MTNNTLRQKAADRLRRAVTRQAYDEVQAAIADYRREVEAALAAWHADEPPPVEVVREAMDLTKWALQVVRAARARTSNKLDQVSAVLRYRPTVAPRPTWKLEG